MVAISIVGFAGSATTLPMIKDDDCNDHADENKDADMFLLSDN